MGHRITQGEPRCFSGEGGYLFKERGMLGRMRFSVPHRLGEGFPLGIRVIRHCRFKLTDDSAEGGIAEIIAFAHLHIAEPVFAECNHQRIEVCAVLYFHTPDIGDNSKFFKHVN